MKKAIIVIIGLMLSIVAFASDTLVVKKPIRFDSEVIITKSGNKSVKYYAILDGKYYDTNKTAIKRYKDIIRFNGVPCVIMITSGKTNKRITVL